MAHIFLYLFALISLSTSPNWAKLNHMPAEVLGFYRLLGAFILLFAYIFIKKVKIDIKLNRAFFWSMCSAFLFFLHLWTYKYAAKHTLVSNTMILFATNPIWASLGGLIFFKEKIKSRVIIAFAFAFTGTLMLVFENLRFAPENTQGNMVSLLSAVFYASYMVTSKKAREQSSNEQYALIQYGLSMFCFLILSISTKAQFTHYDSISWWAVVGLIVFPTFLGHYSFTYLVKHMNLAFMTCGKLIEPVIASIIAYYLFSEQLGSLAFFAFALTGFSVVLLFWPSLATAYQKRIKH